MATPTATPTSGEPVAQVLPTTPPADAAERPSTPAEAAEAAAQLRRCEAWKDAVLSKDPTVLFLLKHLRRGGCALPPTAVGCTPCPPTLAGGYTSARTVVLCANRLTSRAHTATTLTHELIHAYDDCRGEVDWGRCAHHACSEVRAAALSGDCAFLREVVARGNWALRRQFRACVRRRAVLSVEMNAGCVAEVGEGGGAAAAGLAAVVPGERSKAERAVDAVWTRCYADTAPFDRIP
ncbi:hypothetical protein MMPV_000302 [Pyropia vietnamensis]